MVRIIENENIINHVSEYDGILIGTNCYQVMSTGMQYEIARKYPLVKKLNDSTKYADSRKLGKFVLCDDYEETTFILAFISMTYNMRGNDEPFIDYDAFTEIIKLFNLTYKGANIATNMIGCNHHDGNADKDKILTILNKELTNINLTIFDYKEETCKEIAAKEYREEIRKKKQEERLAKIRKQMKREEKERLEKEKRKQRGNERRIRALKKYYKKTGPKPKKKTNKTTRKNGKKNHTE